MTANTTRVRPSRRSGFTLVEMLIVIALIVVLGAVLSIAVADLMNFKSLKFARNSIAGYLEGVRSEAVNRNTGMLVVVLPTSEDDLKQYNITVKQGEGKTTIPVGPGIITFIVNKGLDNDIGNKAMPVWERVLYLDRNFIFEDEFNADIGVEPALVRRWENMKLPTIDNVSAQDLAAVGIPNGALVMYIRPDGRMLIPGDVPGYIVDSGDPKQIDGDLILKDDEETLFLDISPLARVRGYLINNDLLGPWPN